MRQFTIGPGVGRGPRLALALALAATACGDGPSGPGPSTIEVTGRVFTLDGGSPAGLAISAVGSSTQTASVAADGTFRIHVARAGDSIDYIIDVAAGSRTYIPALVRAPAGIAPDLRIVLLPRQWVVDRGSYSGVSVTILPDSAFRAPCTTPGDTNCDGFFPRVWTETGMKLWPTNALPIRLAFDRIRSNQPITAGDSVAFWDIADRMNSDFGDALFRPARYDEITVAVADGRPDRAVLVRIDTTLTGFGAWTNWWWNAAGEMYAGVVRPVRANLLRSSALMTHELLHTHGFKHTCSWATVMGGYGCSSIGGLSVKDVAHAHVALRVHAMQQQTGAPHGIVAALQGERRRILNQPLFAAPDAPRLRLLRSDAIFDGGDHAH